MRKEIHEIRKFSKKNQDCLNKIKNSERKMRKIFNGDDRLQQTQYLSYFDFFTYARVFKVLLQNISNIVLFIFLIQTTIDNNFFIIY